jgi:hypothetical protein
VETVDTTVAALYVDPKGVYAGLSGVEVWDEARDARLYDGPWPVVAHPPCARWCRLAGFVEYRGGAARGADGGCFAAALAAVRTYGGVLEHPAHSAAWATFGLVEPSVRIGWTGCLDGGWVTVIEQGQYGCSVAKPTWLYAFGVELPALLWSAKPSSAESVWGFGRSQENDPRPRLARNERAATPEPFRDTLLAMARSALISNSLTQ